MSLQDSFPKNHLKFGARILSGENLMTTYLDEHLYNTDRDQFPLLEAILEQFVYKFCFLILELLLVDYFLRF